MRESNHAEFQELCALANTGILSAAERLKVRHHLAVCPACAEAYGEYKALITSGIPALAAAHAHPTEIGGWDERSTRRALLARIKNADQGVRKERNVRSSNGSRNWAVLIRNSWLRAAVAACVLASLGYSTYLLGRRRQPIVQHVSLASTSDPQSAEQEKSIKKRLVSQAEKIALLESESSTRQAELDRLRSALKNLELRSHEIASANEESQDELRSASTQRDTLSARLTEAQQAYADAQKELANLKSERVRLLQEVASLETSTQDLKAANKEQERRLQEDEQYLAADRDIRELMGARKLYIADVFDVDSGSRTRKPYGRVFYTENKSLIFYAFDLDREPRVKNATFQVWGAKDDPQNEKSRPLNLGILYMDSESNRRWVLRIDDPKRLAEIDAIFVTVEPHGGSVKPTSKPLLYALLRKEANHP